MPLGADVHSYANFLEAKTTHIHLDLECDFNKKVFFGFVELTLEAVTDVEKVLLDTKNLEIKTVEDLTTKKTLSYELAPKHESLGTCLNIKLAEKASKGSEIKIKIGYSTTPASAGIQWFEPSQTASKQYPFAYTQCEAILSRTLLPNQDVPAVKAPYSIKVTCVDPLIAACSATAVGEPKKSNGKITYEYAQKNPIPSYLIAIVVGDLGKASVGPRSSVWAEKKLLDRSAYEFAETEKFIKAGEEITGMPYDWGVYDMVVLPAAFPYGGMENPNLTFLSASLLAGDRSLTNVVAHEIVHSWAGNYTTNSGWNEFWLNEGFTVYIERQILGQLYGAAYRDFESLLGYEDLKKTVKAEDPRYTKLVTDLEGTDPDEAFNKTPYEKGSLFLRYLETKVGGLENMQKWLKSYFNDYRFKSLDTEQMKKHFLNFFTNIQKVDQSALDSIDWNTFLFDSGLPSTDLINPDTLYDKSLVRECKELADKWLTGDFTMSTSKDLDSLKPKQKMYFIDLLIAAPQGQVDAKKIELLNETFKFSEATNVEILFRFLMLCLTHQVRSVYPAVRTFLSTYGRGLYVRPMYRLLMDTDLEFALELFNTNKNFYHSIMVDWIGREIEKKKSKK